MLENLKQVEKRDGGAIITLIVGLILNIGLGVSKLVAGLLAKSNSVASDGVNNLSDAAVSLMSVIAVSLAARAADHDHPYGHGRYEYIATFVLGTVIAVVGIELFKSGVERAIAPEEVETGVLVWTTLGISIGVKAFMGVFYLLRSRRNTTIKAAAVDSFSDVAVTSAVLICMIIQSKTGVDIDGYVSIGVSVIILVFAFRILKGVVARLLGARPDPDLTNKINDILSSSKLAISSHDLVINDYGENKKIAEVDLTFPADMSFVDVHAECDRIEKQALSDMGVTLSIHADPLITSDDRLVKIGTELNESLKDFGVSAHDVVIDDENKKVDVGVTIPNDKVDIDGVKNKVSEVVKSVLNYDVELHTDFM